MIFTFLFLFKAYNVEDIEHINESFWGFEQNQLSFTYEVNF